MLLKWSNAEEVLAEMWTRARFLCLELRVRVYRGCFTHCSALAISPLFEMYVLPPYFLSVLFISTYPIFALPNKKLSISHPNSYRLPEFTVSFTVSWSFSWKTSTSSLRCCLWSRPLLTFGCLCDHLPHRQHWWPHCWRGTSVPNWCCWLNHPASLLLQHVQHPPGS